MRTATAGVRPRRRIQESRRRNGNAAADEFLEGRDWMMRRALVVLLGATAQGASALEPINSAERCGACHRAIHEAWKSSAHSKSMESRLFQDALELAESDFGEAATRSCLPCHTPLGV